MKRIIILSLFLSLFNISNASTIGDVNIIKSTKNMRILSNKIIKQYIFLYSNNVKRISVEDKNKIFIEIDSLTKEIKNISKYNNNKDNNNILEFLSYTKEEIKDIVDNKDITIDNIEEMLDQVFGFTEGTISIYNNSKYKFSKQEKMLMHSKDLSLLLEEISLYYFTRNLNIQKNLSEAQLKIKIELFEKKLNIFKNHENTLKAEINLLSEEWNANKIIINKKSIFIPLIFSKLILLEKQKIQKLEKYHSKN